MKPRGIKRLIRIPLLIILLLVLLASASLFSSVYTYQRLTDEALVAVLWFRPAGQGWEANVRTGDFCTEQRYLLNGDQWRLDARFVKWKPVVNLLGVNARYRLERLESRFSDIETAHREHPVAYGLSTHNPLDFSEFIAHLPSFLSPIDTEFGSSVYETVDPAFEYRVYRSQAGLIVRRQAMHVLANTAGGTLTIRIEGYCQHKNRWDSWTSTAENLIGK